MRRYSDVTGHALMMPGHGLEFWQSKLRYENQEELMAVAREYKRRDIPIDVIVCDYFHWPLQDDWDWDTTAWPNPESMAKEPETMKIKLIVSVWPTVDKRSRSFSEMVERGYLVHVDCGIHTTRD
ncbi:hypothetical protein G7Z17_g7227 [Cylindrodendrum hubeiense]|uniref:Glycoside hydrolase family 31 TIM barrel domain-containing protein n=1 Tax=Cylindrodendrum hubeiense TaxID=595255 RepID=A0A9P5H8R3_9HYPO|nr:hypothetical protein G7Z17_g7227 [Cylindrodendrum hubeiense]